MRQIWGIITSSLLLMLIGASTSLAASSAEDKYRESIRSILRFADEQEIQVFDVRTGRQLQYNDRLVSLDRNLEIRPHRDSAEGRLGIVYTLQTWLERKEYRPGDVEPFFNMILRAQMKEKTRAQSLAGLIADERVDARTKSILTAIQNDQPLRTTRLALGPQFNADLQVKLPLWNFISDLQNRLKSFCSEVVDKSCDRGNVGVPGTVEICTYVVRTYDVMGDRYFLRWDYKLRRKVVSCRR